MYESDFLSSIPRTLEFLSCARTCLKILQQKTESRGTLPPELQFLNPNELNLFHSVCTSDTFQNDAVDVLNEATLTLSLLSSTLTTLKNLVKRRGSTNDPTVEINKNMSSFQTYSKDLLEILQNSLPRAAISSPWRESNEVSSNQRIKHYETIGQVLKLEADKHMTEFKKLLEIRGNVLKEIALRRKQLNMNMIHAPQEFSSQHESNLQDLSTRGSRQRPLHRIGRTDKEISSLKSQWDSPLFSVTSQTNNHTHYPIKNKLDMNESLTSEKIGHAAQSYDTNHYRTSPSTNTIPSNAKVTSSSFKSQDYNVGYGGHYGYGGYGTTSSTMGMRHRVTTNTIGSSQIMSNQMYQSEEESKVHDSNSVQAQIQMRRQSRRTQTRIESARQAEKTLSELTQMFGKMSNLIQSQGETLLKIEDDVEAAFEYVESGREELIKLHEWTSGNRGFIVKIFAILICLIVVMRSYG